MSIVTQTDKRTGITYAYDTTYYWDKEKQQSRSKRVCVGKVDPETGDIVPTRGRAKKGSKSTGGKPAKTRPKPFEYSCAMKSHFRKSGNQMSGKWKSSCASLLA